MKENSRKKNYSLSIAEVKDSCLRKSSVNCNTLYKSRRNTAMNDSKLYTESLIYDRLEKSLVSHKMSKNNDMCLEILKTFRKGIIETL